MAAGVSLAGEDKADRPLITVSGVAEVKVVPDQVELRVGVEARSKDVGAAVEQQREQIKEVIALAENHGVEEKNIQTDYLNIRPVYASSKNGRFLDYYAVYRGVAITLKDPSKFDSLVAVLIQPGVNQVFNIRFKTTERRKYKDQARAQAMAAAQEKASAMAGRLGQKIGKAFSIEEQEVEAARSAVVSMNRVIEGPGGSGDAGDDALALGRISVEARVKVRFELQ